MNDENTKLRQELNELNETRRRLQQEIDSLKLQLNEKSFTYERLNLEKSNFEGQLQRERDDVEKVRKNFDQEMNLVKGDQLKLSEKLGFAEAKLISTEKELTYTRTQIEDREKQISSLREELVKSKSDYSIQLNLLRIEKEEKEGIFK